MGFIKILAVIIGISLILWAYVKFLPDEIKRFIIIMLILGLVFGTPIYFLIKGGAYNDL